MLCRLDQPITGLHAALIDWSMHQLQRLVDAGATVVVVAHDRRVIAACDRVIDMGTGGGEAGGQPRQHPPGTRIAAL